MLLNSDLTDDEALARPHLVRGQWFSDLIPVQVVGSGLPIQFWYFNMKRLGAGLQPDPDKSIPGMVLSAIGHTLISVVVNVLRRVVGVFSTQDDSAKVE